MKMKKIIALSVTLFLLVLIFYKIDLYELYSTLKNFRIKFLFYIVPLYIFTLYLRGIRWKALLLNDKKYSSLRLAEIFTVGSMLNSFVPARAGDFYRAYYLGDVMNEKKVKVFGSVIMERILDGVAVFGLLFFSVILYSKVDWVINLTYLTGGIFLGGLVVVYSMLKFNKIDAVTLWVENLFRKFGFTDKCTEVVKNISDLLKSFLAGFEVLNSLKCFNIAIFTSFLIWFIEAIIAYLVMHSLNLQLGMSAGMFATALTSFSTVIPSASVFLGPYQYAYILALGLFNINKNTALAVCTMHQGILMLILAIVGGFYLLKFNISLKDIKDKK